MSTVLGAALVKAFDAKKPDYSKFVWKGPKVRVGDHYEQEVIKLVDATPGQLIKFKNHCEKMLHNEDPRNPGRYNVLELVKEQINKCNIELLIRYFKNVYLSSTRTPIERYNLMLMLRALMHNNPQIEDWGEVKMHSLSVLASEIPGGLPDEFSNVSVLELLDGCTDSLGAFNKSHITMSFIVNMGIWFTKSEELEFKEKFSSNMERLKAAKDRLRIPDKIKVKFNDKGLSFHEMRAILTLPKQQKYSDMTTEQLLTLRNKILLRYLREVDSHIYSWKKLIREIDLVAYNRGLKLS